MRHDHPICFAAMVGGMIGLLVAIVIALGGPHTSTSAYTLIEALWPTAIAGIVWTEPPGFNGTTVLMVTVLYGGNAFVYAIVASTLTGLVLGIKALFNKKNRRPLSIKPD
jgi:ABC-type antimicrobial peptide transport system permease subunit